MTARSDATGPGSGLGAGAAYALRAGRAVLADPSAGFERIADRLAERRAHHEPAFPYVAASDWQASLHEVLGLPWPCPMDDEFDTLWQQMLDELAQRGLVPGRGTFNGWDDGGRALVRAVYCLVRHQRPERVVETGVGHGVTTRFILAALERNGTGQLWSIDLPPLIARHLEVEVGVAVPEALRDRWTLLRGSSRQQLRPLLTRLGSIDLFLHDSMHTTRNLRFELVQAWPALRAGGVVVADDIDYNRAFGEFARQGSLDESIVARHEDTDRLFGILVKASAHTTVAH